MADEILYSRKKLPVWALARRSYGFVWAHARLLAVPLLLVFAAQIVAGLGSQGIAMIAGRWALPLILAWSLLIMILSMSFIVGLHRTVLLDEIREGARFLRWDKYLWNYLMAWLTVLIVSLAAAVLIGFALFVIFGTSQLMTALLFDRTIAFPLLLAPILLWAFFSLKFGLAFPAAALGYRDVFHLSWRLTAGNLLRLLAALILVGAPFVILSIALAAPTLLGTVMAAPSAPRVGLVLLASLLVNAAIRAASLSVMTTALSLSFFFLFKAADDAGDFAEDNAW
jgi:hypothetical protein